jgi:TRAP-type C4-dicarboxylate transport system substrate-binding protein
LKISILTFPITLNFPTKALSLTVKIGTLAPADSDWLKIIGSTINDTLKNYPDIKVYIYPGGVLGDEEEMVKKIADGQIDGGIFTLQGIKKTVPEIRVLDLPMLLKSYDEADRITDKFFPEFQKIYEKRGFKLLLLTEQGFSYFFTTRKDVNSLKDLGKTRFWSWKEERVPKAIAEILGANIISLPAHAVYEALGSVMVETFNTAPLTCLIMQWCKFAKTIIDLPFRFESGVFIIATKTWESIPENVRNEIERKFKENRKIINQKIREGNESALKKIKDMGLKFVKPSQSEIDWFENQVKDKIWFSKDSEYPHELLKKLLDELEKTKSK